jgi:hypothetical protein
MTDQQIMHKANGIARIAQAVKLCDLAPVETGTIYSKRFIKFKPLLLDRFWDNWAKDQSNIIRSARLP